MTAIKPLDLVTLTVDLPAEGLWRGIVGTVIEQWDNDVFEVEFNDDKRNVHGSFALLRDQLMKLYGMKKTLQQWLGASKLIALVFTDVVESTTLGNHLGDEQWFKALLGHFAQARQYMAAYDCYEIKIIGDSFMVAFRNAVDALDFALAFHADTGDARIVIRTGIHIGSVRVIENDIFGTMVNYTKRVESTLNPKFIMLSDEAMSHIRNEKALRHADLKYRPRTIEFKGFSMRQKVWLVVYPDMLESLTQRLAFVTSLLPKREIPSSAPVQDIRIKPTQDKIAPPILPRFLIRPRKDEGKG